MKLHDLKPAPGSHTARTRVGRGIAAGKGKTAGRGTKGQKARAGGSIPPWFEGGQTPLHMRLPKLRGFKNRFKVEYEVVNIGAIAAAAERGAFEGNEPDGPKAKAAKGAPPTVNQDLLRAVGLVRTLTKPLKILGAGELSTSLFVVADAFTKSAVAKIEAAGGTVSVLEVPATRQPAIGVGEDGGRTAREPRTAAGRAAAAREVDAKEARVADAAERESVAAATAAASEAKAAKASKSKKAAAAEDASKAEPEPEPEVSATAEATPADEAPVAEAQTEPEAEMEPHSEDSASPLEAGDATDAGDAPATDVATETDTPSDGENA
jgi:large subunit ribosomal protein L15